MDILRIKWVNAECLHMYNTADTKYIMDLRSTLRWLIWGEWYLLHRIIMRSRSISVQMEFHLPVLFELLAGSLYSWLSFCGNIDSFMKLSCRIYTSPCDSLPIHSNAFSAWFVINKFYSYNLIQIIIHITMGGRES